MNLILLYILWLSSSILIYKKSERLFKRVKLAESDIILLRDRLKQNCEQIYEIKKHEINKDLNKHININGT